MDKANEWFWSPYQIKKLLKKWDGHEDHLWIERYAKSCKIHFKDKTGNELTVMSIKRT